MTESAPVKEKTGIQAEEVAAYLQEHPDFFQEHEELLEELRLPHPSGSAISLVARQISLFREQRDRYESQLLELVEIARQNDSFFEKSKRLLLNLMEAQTLDDVVVVLQDSFLEDFGLGYCSLSLCALAEDYPKNLQANLITEKQARNILGEVLDQRQATCGILANDRAHFLFPQQGTQVRSAAIVPLETTELLGVLSIGSGDPAYFDQGMGTLFLSYISDCLCRLLPAMMAREKKA